MIPGLLIGVSLLILFTDLLSIQPSTTTAIVGQTVLVTPFVILIVSRGSRASTATSSARPPTSAQTRSSGCASSSCRCSRPGSSRRRCSR